MPCEGEGLGSYTGPVAEDASAGWGGEHGIAEAGDEVWRCSRFTQGGYKIYLCFSIPPGQMGVGGVSLAIYNFLYLLIFFSRPYTDTYLLVWG